MEECCICFEILVTEIAILSCNHKMHYKCIFEYQEKLNSSIISCPLCRRNVTLSRITSLFGRDRSNIEKLHKSNIKKLHKSNIKK